MLNRYLEIIDFIEVIADTDDDIKAYLLNQEQGRTVENLYNNLKN